MAFGGSVKLTGADEYKNALRDITQNLKLMSAEMKATSTSFDAGEKSEKQMIQSSKEMKKALDDQKEALNDLVKNKLPAMVKEYEAAERKHKSLSSELKVEEKTLEELKRKFGDSSDEVKEQEKVVDDLKNKVKLSQTEYERLGKNVDNAKLEIAKTETTINQTTVALDKMGNEAEESGKDAEKGSEGFTVMKGVLANLASQAISSAIDGLKQLGSTFIDVGKEALNSYADYEQLTGGVETLFGNEYSSVEEYAKATGMSLQDAQASWEEYQSRQQTVLDNASNAYKTSGLSANEYMETVTGFAASLNASLGEYAWQSANYADMAVGDMADNANKMGSSMESVQNAYAGFAKGNFTMLDNLKLG